MSTRVNQLKPHLVVDTGITINIKKVSPLLALEIRNAIPKPRPPSQEVDYGDGKKVLEENPAHPSYKAALKEYEDAVQEKTNRFVIERGVDCKVDHEAVKELRESWKAEFGQDLPYNDKYCYIAFIVLGTNEDFQELIEIIMSRSGISSAAMEAAQEQLKSQVSG